MYEIKIKLRPDEDFDIDSFEMQIVANLVSFNPRPHTQEHGYPWSLDDSNDWEAKYENGILTVAYRYGGGHKDFMSALRTVLAWHLDGEEIKE